MISLKPFGRVTAALAVACVVAAPAAIAQGDRPDATITFSGGSVAFIAGVKWGSGELDYHGKRITLEVKGLGIGSIGASSYKATGEVYNLHKVSDIEGTYGAASASATAGAGAGAITMTNGNGVRIEAHTSSAGLQLTVAASGVDIRIKH
jgi:hypothetical protein